MYDTLLYLDPDGKVQPNAAEKWQYTADGRTLTLTLRTGMKFSNGTPVTSAAVKATLDRIKTVPGPQYASMVNVDGVTATDDSTVVVKFKQPDAGFLPGLTGPLGVIADPATMAQPSSALDPVASGPYTLEKSGTVAGSTYVLKRREDYWNKSAYPFKKVSLRVFTDPTASLNALKSGQTNASPIDSRDGAQLKAAGFTITRVDATVVAALIIADRGGVKVPALKDLRVRQAINLALDRAKINKVIQNGVGKPTNQLFNVNGDGYDPAVDNTYGYNVTQAKKLMADAGYAKGFSISIPSPGFTKPYEPTLVQELGEIGIKATFVAVPPQNIATEISSQKYPVVIFMNGLTYPASEMQTNFAPTGLLNPFHTTDPQLTKLMTDVNAAQDPTAAATLYKQISAFAVKNAWAAPIAYNGNDWATKGVKYVENPLVSSTLRAFALPD
ncbi:ABC transporter substrate-binding protein [Cryptosporangium sp. NPDC048952]|uniref:ABC transporter substrate-binding protein n=1 Tax=Cryptosporangium sp. NPDC048952 TaxID=3363961 RepID=UPI0037128007